MEFLQNLDLGQAGLLVGVSVCLCGGLVILGLLLQVLGGALEIVLGVFELFFNILSGGPVAWCGCLVVIFGCCGCTLVLGLGTSVLATCGTPEQVNLCRVLGY